MRFSPLITGSLVALVVISGGSIASVPLVFADRILPFVALENYSLTGISRDDVPGVVRQYERALQMRSVKLTLKGQPATRSFGELGVRLNVDATAADAHAVTTWRLLRGRGQVRPRVEIDDTTLQTAVQAAYGSAITVPRNATLGLTPSTVLTVIKGEVGESVDVVSFERDLGTTVLRGSWDEPIELVTIAAPPAVQDHEVQLALTFAEQLLRDGLTLTDRERSWAVKPFTLRRLLEFVAIPDPADPTNAILGVTLNEEGLAQYLETTIAPEITTIAHDARFTMDSAGQVTQLVRPVQGQALDIPESVRQARARLAAREASAPLTITVTEPEVSLAEDINALGITTLLTTGESNFAGSPSNRIHNIKVGTARYHGLLIPPQADFSFNEFLGPVTAAAGYKPELVIKHNVTTPEYGGGLCQVSTTLFRAAVQAGLEITDRRNHAYAVRYYGVPGFDATIYPPYTDLRFTNNTPSYLLVQARIEGTTLKFELWGSNDGRTVEVEGPVTYDRQSNGAVKATLTQRVTKEGVVTIDKTFYSRYKSPALFPKAAAANAPQPTPTPPSVVP